jgi:hypothetical protein
MSDIRPETTAGAARGAMTRRAAPPRVSEVQILRLHHLRGPRAGQYDVVSLVRGATALLGRAPDADIPFPEPENRTVSRRHALLWLATDDEHGWHVVDLESTAGTHLNGRRVHTQRLGHGDLVSLGASGPAMRVDLTVDRAARVWGPPDDDAPDPSPPRPSGPSSPG